MRAKPALGDERDLLSRVVKSITQSRCLNRQPTDGRGYKDVTTRLERWGPWTARHGANASETAQAQGGEVAHALLRQIFSGTREDSKLVEQLFKLKWL